MGGVKSGVVKSNSGDVVRAGRGPCGGGKRRYGINRQYQEKIYVFRLLKRERENEFCKCPGRVDVRFPDRELISEVPSLDLGRYQLLE